MKIMIIGKGLKMKDTLGMTQKELNTIIQILDGKTQKEVAYDEGVTEACISDRISRVMTRNGYKNKTQFLLDCEKLRRNKD